MAHRQYRYATEVEEHENDEEDELTSADENACQKYAIFNIPRPHLCASDPGNPRLPLQLQ